MKERREKIAVMMLTGAVFCWAFWIGEESTRPSTQKPGVDSSTEEQNRTAPLEFPPALSESEKSTATPESDEVEKEPGPIAPLPRAASLAAMERPQMPATPPAGIAVEEDSPTVMPVTALENLRSAFRQYAARLGGNPVGDNAEMTAALTGKNVRRQVFVSPEDGLRTDGQGQFVDHWGTPYFFHQLSRTEMEIRSAGPDKRMWTSDDLVMK